MPREDLEIGISEWTEPNNHDAKFITNNDGNEESKSQTGYETELDVASKDERHDEAKESDDDDSNNTDDGEDNDHKERVLPLSLRPTLRRHSRFRKKSSIVRRKTSADVETGSSLEHVIQCKCVKDEIYFYPMNPRDRWWKMVWRHKDTPKPRQSSFQETVCHQYRLTSHKKARGVWNTFKSFLSTDDFHAARGFNSLIADSLIWTFQTRFLFVFLAVFAFCVFNSLIFGLWIYAVGRHQPDCIKVDEKNFNDSGHNFMDAFSLSWQTLTTAGYGVIRPSVTSPTNRFCVGLDMFIALESFCGVIFAGCITAIVFSKVVREQAVAAVDFSDPIVVRYGTGVMLAEEDNMSEMSSDDEETMDHTAKTAACKQNGDSNGPTKKKSVTPVRFHNNGQLPCPILEFRLFNRLHDQVGGEICNAKINIVAVTSASSASSSTRASAAWAKQRSAVLHKREASRRRKKQKSITRTLKTGSAMLRHSASRATVATNGFFQKSGDVLLRKSGTAAVHQKLHQSLTAIPETRSDLLGSLPENDNIDPDRLEPYNHMLECSQHLAVDEEPSSAMVPRRVFSKLEIETNLHPFFKRVWNIRHVLNEHSPILSDEAKQMIQENQGSWPEELNHYKQIRKQICFHEILANFSGTSNVSGTRVYSQKVYDFMDVNIGYRFANMLLKDENGKLVVDATLLNDVNEQLGGGGEPFAVVMDSGSIFGLNTARVTAKAAVEVAVASADATVRLTTAGVTKTTAAAATVVARAKVGIDPIITGAATAVTSNFQTPTRS